MRTFHPIYTFNAPEVTNEYNLLNEFLSTSLLDDGAAFISDDEIPPSKSRSANESISHKSLVNSDLIPNLHHDSRCDEQFRSIDKPDNLSRPPVTISIDKAREQYYLTAADPSGSDAPDARINKLLQAKYDAGMLRPFNYVKGYARLNQYIDRHMQSVSRQKILRQLDKFRPKFRERMQGLTDVELIVVEMWFERCLMEYDRVFASMAIPACCWRRTGEIFRGNKEMAELIHVPVEDLRDVSAPFGT